jgi:TPR repeat protein
VKNWIVTQTKFPTVALVETTKGLIRGKLCWAQLLAAVFLVTACREQKSPAENESKQTAQEKADSLEQWRQNRALARAKTEAETPIHTSPKTNAIDPEKAKKALSSFSDKLKGIVGESMPTDNELLKKAEKGDVTAQIELAAKFWSDGDFDSAVKWYRKAAEQGDVRAEHALGIANMSGQGANGGFEEAIKWFKKAAEKGNMDSQYSLGLRYVRGDHVERDFTEAAKWFKMAANQGQPDSQVSLARRYAAGEGVEKDVVEAYKWALIADDYWSAVSYRQELEKNLTPEEIAQAKERAKNFKPVKTIAP